MKKTIALILTLITIFLLLSSCNLLKKDTKTPDPVTKPDDLVSTTSEDDKKEVKEEEKKEEVAEVLITGTLTDNSYSNEALGISITIPEGWRFASDEEIAKAMQVGADIMFDDPTEFKEKIKEYPSFFDVMALESNYGRDNFNIGYTDIVKTGLGAFVTEPVYVGLLESQFKTMEVYQGAELSVGKHKLGNVEFSTLSIDSTKIALQLYQRQYIKKIGSSYLICVTITSPSEEGCDTIASLFK